MFTLFYKKICRPTNSRFFHRYIRTCRQGLVPSAYPSSDCQPSLSCVNTASTTDFLALSTVTLNTTASSEISIFSALCRSFSSEQFSFFPPCFFFSCSSSMAFISSRYWLTSQVQNLPVFLSRSLLFVSYSASIPESFFQIASGLCLGDNRSHIYFVVVNLDVYHAAVIPDRLHCVILLLSLTKSGFPMETYPVHTAVFMHHYIIYLIHFTPFPLQLKKLQREHRQVTDAAVI